MIRVNKRLLFEIHYYSRKPDVVIDATSQKSVGNLTYVLTLWEELIWDMEWQELEVIVRIESGMMATNIAQPTLVDEIRVKQHLHPSLKKICDEIS